MLLKRGRNLCGNLFMVGEGDEFMLVLLGNDGSRNWRGYALHPRPDQSGHTIRLYEGPLGACEEGKDWSHWKVRAGSRVAHFEPQLTPEGDVHLWIQLLEDAQEGGSVITHQGLLVLPGGEFFGPEEIRSLYPDLPNFPKFT